MLLEVKFNVIRGNISEIKTLAMGTGKTKGVDADKEDRIKEDNLEDTIAFAQKLSGKTGAIIAITGAIDIVANEKKAYIIHNGHPMMSKVTGTGCMLTAIIGAFCAANPAECIEAAAVGMSAMGLCGEQAFEKISNYKEGTGSYKVYLMDFMSKMNPEILKAGAKIEER